MRSSLGLNSTENGSIVTSLESFALDSHNEGRCSSRGGRGGHGFRGGSRGSGSLESSTLVSCDEGRGSSRGGRGLVVMVVLLDVMF